MDRSACVCAGCLINWYHWSAHPCGNLCCPRPRRAHPACRRRAGDPCHSDRRWSYVAGAGALYCLAERCWSSPMTASLASPGGGQDAVGPIGTPTVNGRSEEHTSELQSLMRISYAVFCLTKKKQGIKRNRP